MNKNARIEARLTGEVYAMIKRAAEIEGRSLSDFVVSAAREAAVRTIEQVEIIQLFQKNQERFAAELIDPSPLTSAMERALKRHRELVDESA